MCGLYQPYDPDQCHLFPPSPRDWLPEDHLAYFVSDTVDQLDIREIDGKYRRRGAGTLAYHPRMMLKLLIYSYSVGIFSSRQIAKGVQERIPLRVLAAGHIPSHRTICRFRTEHLEALVGLFAQVVRIAKEAGLVKMGTLAIDGTKLKANASKHKAMTYGRMQEEEKRLEAEIAAITKMAADLDAKEDVEFGPDFRGDELPDELARRESRLEVIQAAKKRLEERTKAADAAAMKKEKQRKAEGEPRRGPKRKRQLGTPDDKAQENFTDPDSRIMKGKDGYQQCYNAQTAVDEEALIIVAAEVTNTAADVGMLIPTVDAACKHAGESPSVVLADAGYRSEAGLADLEERRVTGYVALGRKDQAAGKDDDDKPATARMRATMRSKTGRDRYRKRKHIAEAPFGWIKRVLGFQSFSLRGKQKVAAEWSLVCLCVNIRRMSERMAWS